MASGKKDRRFSEFEIINKRVEENNLHKKTEYLTSYDNGEMASVREKIKNVSISNN